MVITVISLHFLTSSSLIQALPTHPSTNVDRKSDESLRSTKHFWSFTAKHLVAFS